MTNFNKESLSILLKIKEGDIIKLQKEISYRAEKICTTEKSIEAEKEELRLERARIETVEGTTFTKKHRETITAVLGESAWEKLKKRDINPAGLFEQKRLLARLVEQQKVDKKIIANMYKVRNFIFTLQNPEIIKERVAKLQRKTSAKPPKKK